MIERLTVVQNDEERNAGVGMSAHRFGSEPRTPSFDFACHLSVQFLY